MLSDRRAEPPLQARTPKGWRGPVLLARIPKLSCPRRTKAPPDRDCHTTKAHKEKCRVSDPCRSRCPSTTPWGGSKQPAMRIEFDLLQEWPTPPHRFPRPPRHRAEPIPSPSTGSRLCRRGFYWRLVR